MAHRRAKLTPFGRLLLIQRIVDLQWPVTQAATSLGVSRPIAYKWLARWQSEGVQGLEDRASRPHTSPRATPERRVHQLLRLRRQLRQGPHRLAPLVGLSPSTIYDILRRHGLSRLRDADRSSGVPVRYVREHPGELVHVDMKPLARVPAGGGHRMHGRSATVRPRGGGYEVVHVAVDDASRLAFGQIRPDGRGPAAAHFLVDAGAFYAEHGIRIQRIMTDRSRSYTTSRAFQDALQELRIRHKVTRPYRPQTNGKAERFIQTLLGEWAYARLYRSNEERLRAFPKWLHHYNYQRPHTALGGQPPIAAAVNNVSGKHI